MPTTTRVLFSAITGLECGGGLRLFLCGQSFFDRRPEFGGASVRAFGQNDPGVAVDKDGAGDGVDAVLDSQGGFPKFTIIYLGPGHVVVLSKLSELGASVFLIEADSEDLETF